MKKQTLEIEGRRIPCIESDVLIIGSGCAGYAAADWLAGFGCRDVVMVTEGRETGTSRNAGSDKQTYYKLSLCGDQADSVEAMARSLFEGGGMDGETALCQAAESVRCFMKLCDLGVPFPVGRYGEYPGYQTDHDGTRRATSAGPLTSRYMTECLERSALGRGLELFDRMQAVRLLQDGERVLGLLALDLDETGKGREGLTLFRSGAVILATGGPAAVYRDRVYPDGQTGGLYLALQAGADCVNLQHWQYGLASIDFKWNLSGAYQQALPRYVSVGKDGEEREFLLEAFSPGEMLHQIFLKGYQWPFDSRKIPGSSQIDLLVQQETGRGRQVYLDFTRNPAGLEEGLSGLHEEAYSYLQNSDGLADTPVERLARMNPAAVDLYRSHGIDLYREKLRIAVCAQHLNGGVYVDENWQSTLPGLYAVGETAGTFGAYRPGGSALNAAMTGALRAARHIAASVSSRTAQRTFPQAAARAVEETAAVIRTAMEPGTASPVSIQEAAAARMSTDAAAVREQEALGRDAEAFGQKYRDFPAYAHIENIREIPALFTARGTLLTQWAVLEAMGRAAEEEGSRGGALVVRQGCPTAGRGEGNRLLRTKLEGGRLLSFYQPARPIPQRDNWFERVYKELFSNKKSE